MKKILKFLGLPQEAILLDSGLYLLKAFLALWLTYTLSTLKLGLKTDMISILLGVMYTLEPTNRAGFRGGIQQLITSSLGALITGLLVLLVGYQISAWVVALGVVLTLYISLKQDYRFVSPAALFTSIYMTQLIQTNASNQPSVWMTFVVRISSLGFGIMMALLFNYLFSFVYYRNLGQKRLEFVRKMCVDGLKKTLSVLKDPKLVSDKLSVLVLVFSDIEMVKSNLETMMSERNLSLQHQAKLKKTHAQVNAIKNIVHLAYDILYVVQETSVVLSDHQFLVFNEIIQNCESISLNTTNPSLIQWTLPIEPSLRIDQNLTLMRAQIDHLNQL